MRSHFTINYFAAYLYFRKNLYSISNITFKMTVPSFTTSTHHIPKTPEYSRSHFLRTTSWVLFIESNAMCLEEYAFCSEVVSYIGFRSSTYYEHSSKNPKAPLITLQCFPSAMI